jgi:signal peptidase I
MTQAAPLACHRQKSVCHMTNIVYSSQEWTHLDVHWKWSTTGAHMRTRRNVAGLLAVTALAIGLLKGRIRRYVIEEESMTPALAPGDFVMTTRLTRRPNRGDIVIATHPQNPDMDIVKRVIGLPGETITISGGQVHIDGSVLAEPWADGPAHPDGEWNLGPDDMFVLSDARSLTVADSRTLGPIDGSKTLWKVTTVYWPLGRRRRF